MKKKGLTEIYTENIHCIHHYRKKVTCNDKTINMDLIYDDFTLTKLAIFAPPPFHNPIK